MEKKEIIILLNRIEQKVVSFLQNAPDGNLQVASSRNQAHFYLLKQGEREYLGKDSIAMIKNLAFKKYCKLMSKTVEECRKDSALLADDHELYKRLGNVYYKLHKEIRQYVEPFVLPDDLFVKQWLCMKTTPNPYGYGSTEYYTENNERVRSKSELIIADRLKKSGIPYRYEKELVLPNGIKYYPDFTVLDIASRNEIYIEHCGMMDSPEYRKVFYSKMANYALAGITTGKNLILFFEDSGSSLNTMVVDKTINMILNTSKLAR